MHQHESYLLSLLMEAESLISIISQDLQTIRTLQIGVTTPPMTYEESLVRLQALEAELRSVARRTAAHCRSLCSRVANSQLNTTLRVSPNSNSGRNAYTNPYEDDDLILPSYGPDDLPF